MNAGFTLIFALLTLTSCSKKEENVIPAPMALIGTWQVVASTTVTTTPSGSTITTGGNYPSGLYTMVYTTGTYQAYISSVAQGSPVAYSITGTTYAFQDGGKAHAARIEELTSSRFVTTEFSNSAGNVVMLTTTLAR